MRFEGLEIIERNLRNDIENHLRRSGLLYRLFSRIKDNYSISEKITRKGYQGNGKLMQDIIGFRVTAYFIDDVKLMMDFFTSEFEKVDVQYDNPKANEFNPIRKNLVCRLKDDNLKIFNELKSSHQNDFELIDSTFEIQFRSTLSEGWHEVEHNMRYKCKDEWEDLTDQSRILNGIYASLETSDHTLKGLFDDIAFEHYKARNWSGMIRNKFRLRFKLEALKNDIDDAFSTEANLAKDLFKIDRIKLINSLIDSGLRMNMTMDNIVFLCNYLKFKNQKIFAITPGILMDDFNEYLKDKTL